MTDAGANDLLRVAANGTITTLAVFPSDDGHPDDAVPTCVVRGPDGAYYVGGLSGAPFPAGAANIYRIVPGQAPEVVLTGFKTIIDMDFGPDGSLYVLQYATHRGLSGSGALIRVAPDGTRTTLMSHGLVKSTSVLVRADAIYVSNRGNSVGTGEVIRITLDEAPHAAAPVSSPSISHLSGDQVQPLLAEALGSPKVAAAVAGVNAAPVQWWMAASLLTGSSQVSLPVLTESHPAVSGPQPRSETAGLGRNFDDGAAGSRQPDKRGTIGAKERMLVCA